MEIKKYDTNLGIAPITDASHLNHHLNYLCRMDKQQKWTNELTKNNVYIFHSPRTSELAFSVAKDEEERKIFKAFVLKEIRRSADAKGLSWEQFAVTLRQIRSDYLDKETFGFTLDVQEDTKALIAALYEDIPGFHMICAVIHVDQKENWVHIHFLYFED